MTQDYRVSLTLSRRRSKPRTFSVDEHLYPVSPTHADANLFMFQCVGVLMFALKAYTTKSIVQVIGNISNILRSHDGESIPPIKRYQFGPTELLFSFQERDSYFPSKREIERASGKQKL